jgi:hypothetical protein
MNRSRYPLSASESLILQHQVEGNSTKTSIATACHQRHYCISNVDVHNLLPAKVNGILHPMLLTRNSTHVRALRRLVGDLRALASRVTVHAQIPVCETFLIATTLRMYMILKRRIANLPRTPRCDEMSGPGVMRMMLVTTDEVQQVPIAPLIRSLGQSTKMSTTEGGVEATDTIIGVMNLDGTDLNFTFTSKLVGAMLGADDATD